VDLARERRIRSALGELAALVDSGAVDPERTRAYVAGELPGAPVSDADDVPTSLRLLITGVVLRLIKRLT
jgi:hypothetical protein